MKSTVEQLSPTRVRINVEVPFTELEPDFERAYKELAKQVRLPGFRPGKAPAKLLEARIGREAMLDQVISDALPSRYGQAVTESDVRPLGQPEIEVTKKEYGKDLVFTAEVDVRPAITLPDLKALTVTVDPVEVTDEDVEKELQALRARFGTLTPVERPAAEGDIVSIDLSASVDGEEVADAATEGLTHEVGSGQLVDGLDEAIVGLSAGESRVFTTTLANGPHAGQEAQVTVTVGSVKERELPELDDEFAQLASEFDTIDELRANLVEQVRRVKQIQQAEKIRNATLDSLLEQVDIPLPEAIVQAHVDETVHNALHGLDHDEARFAEALAKQGSSREEFDANARAAAEKTVKTQLLLDALADELGIQVSQDDLTERLVLMSRQYGVEPQQLLSFLQQNNQLSAMFADVRRGLTVAAVVEAATVKDTDGNVIDTSEFFGKRRADEADEAEGVDEVQAPVADEAAGGA
ncbi:trigger factor [Mycobacterium xenopi]|uniref:Trigger factor n=1 Tax=Mycobacterium xenopi TaxID=1789 RepID=A0AAD1M0I0_MYCXE|nr:trigger factor [Mycobacterium xenopi]EUA18190.1 trigger factor [Mycobacterium xenopi 3993]MDA3638313.1 trigger factor [Mycobacterium xenopi]MDA3656382.1 trigger factor [Mycobacterium xenopi]MDA3662719.1 trigger factor [Mycobacterium xenopi]ORX21721.1 trigger factor [Mycobacterium xenopi]